MSKEICKILITTEIDTETGEVKTIGRELVNELVPSKPSVKRTVSKKSTVIEDSTPRIVLGENKFSFNTAAVELMGIEPDDRIDVKFRMIDGVETPIIGTNTSFNTKAGNRLTKSYTVSCKGANRERLCVYGDEFVIKPHPDPSAEGLFIMDGNKKPQGAIINDNNFELPSNETEVDITSINPDDLNNLVDGNAQQIQAFDFSL